MVIFPSYVNLPEGNGSRMDLLMDVSGFLMISMDANGFRMDSLIDVFFIDVDVGFRLIYMDANGC